MWSGRYPSGSLHVPKISMRCVCMEPCLEAVGWWEVGRFSAGFIASSDAFSPQNSGVQNNA
eukprot:1318904-Amorphochlora_amoeboformis.AAC.3